MERQREAWNNNWRANTHNHVDNYMHGINHPRMPAMPGQHRPLWRRDHAFAGPPPPPTPPPPYFIPSPYGFFQPGLPSPLPWYARPPPPPPVVPPPVVPLPSETPPPSSVPLSSGNTYSLPPLKDRVCKQFEYYFSEENLRMDTYFKKLMDQEGWIDIQEISKFNMVKSLTQDLSLITEGLRSSEILEVQDLKVRKRV